MSEANKESETPEIPSAEVPGASISFIQDYMGVERVAIIRK